MAAVYSSLHRIGASQADLGLLRHVLLRSDWGPADVSQAFPASARIQGSWCAAVAVAATCWKLKLKLRFAEWTVKAEGKEWDSLLEKATTAQDYARLFLGLEGALKWEGADEKERAFGTVWASRRPDWYAAVKGESNNTNRRMDCSFGHLAP